MFIKLPILIATAIFTQAVFAQSESILTTFANYRSCSKLLTRVENPRIVPFTDADLVTIAEFKAKQDARTMEEVIGNKHYLIPLIPKPTFLINGKTYHLRHPLGGGGEGLVVAAESDGRLYSVKFYRELAQLESNVQEMIGARRATPPKEIPEIIDIDLEAKAVVLEFIYGIGFNEAIPHHRELGEVYYRMSLEAEVNSVVEIPSGRVVKVDPR